MTLLGYHSELTDELLTRAVWIEIVGRQRGLRVALGTDVSKLSSLHDGKGGSRRGEPDGRWHGR